MRFSSTSTKANTSSPKLNCSVRFPLLSADTTLTEQPAMKVTVKQNLHGLKRYVKPNRIQHAPETEKPYKLTVKASIRQYLYTVKHYVKKVCPGSGNTAEPQTSSSSPGCKLKQVRTLFPRVVQCCEKIPETGYISCVEPSRPKLSFELEPDEHITFVEPQPRPDQPQPTCGLKRVPTPHPLAPIDTPPQIPLEYISLAELQEPSTESLCGLDLLPPSFPRPAIDTPPASPKFDTQRTKAISFAELPLPDKSCGLKRVPTPFPLKPKDTPPQSPKTDNKRTKTISFTELPRPVNNCELKRVPTPFPLPPAIDAHSPVDGINNDTLTLDTRRFAWYGPPNFFPNARRYKVTSAIETRQDVRPMDFLRNGRSVVGVG